MKSTNYRANSHEDPLRCRVCKKLFTRLDNRKRHELLHRKQDNSIAQNEKQSSFSCSKCSASFGRKYHRDRHEKTCKSGQYTCAGCNSLFRHMKELEKHLGECKENQPSSSNSIQRPEPTSSMTDDRKQPSEDKSNSNSCSNSERQYRCRKCNNLFPTRKELWRHGLQQHGGRDNLQPVPWEDGHAPWDDNETVDEALKEEYYSNMPHILRYGQEGAVSVEYNFPTNDLSGGIDEIIDCLNSIFNQETYAFKFNIILGLILRNSKTGEYRYFIPYQNRLFDLTFTISNKNDLSRVRHKLDSLDIPTYAHSDRPDTSWRVTLVTNMLFRVFRTHYPLGHGKLPDFIRNKKTIISLDVNDKQQPYNDNLCAFRCLALHQKQRRMEASVKKYYSKWKEFMQKLGIKLPAKPKKYEGVGLDQLSQFESCFELQVTVCELQPSGITIPRHHPTKQYRDKMYMNVHDHHLSYITDFNAYATKFQCSMCDRFFNRSFNARKHMRTCSNLTVFKLPGGIYQGAKSIFDRLEEIGIIVPEHEQFFPWFAVYDFEALVTKIDIQATGKLNWTQKHQPISVSLSSNVPSFCTSQCLVNEDTDILLSEMVKYLITISKTVETLANQKWAHVHEQLQLLINRWRPENIEPASKQRKCDEHTVIATMEDDYENDFDDNEEDEDDDSDSSMDTRSLMYQKVKSIQEAFNQYCCQLPVLGFNSGRYDLNLVKGKLAKYFELTDKSFVVKKGNTYLCISTKNLRILDIIQYLAPGSSYSKFLKAFKIQEKKSYFPYEWFDDASKLNYDNLPPYDAFYSTLKNCNILEHEHNEWEQSGSIGSPPCTGRENYQQLKQIWTVKNMNTFKDFLIFYNNLDVGPFVCAVEKFLEFYKANRIDVFKIAISAPGIARKMLFDCAREMQVSFPLFSQEDEDLYRIVKQNIVGGPSIIFKRYHKVDETYLRNNLNKKCQNILGYDANALYLWAIGQNMPTSIYTAFEKVGQKYVFSSSSQEKYLSMFFWMELIMKEQNVKILHKMNNGQEKRVGPYLVDGYDPRNGVIYEFNGCFYHGHDPNICPITSKIQAESWKARQPKLLTRTQNRLEYLRESGYTVVDLWECDYNQKCKYRVKRLGIAEKFLPPFSKTYRYSPVSKEQIEAAVMSTKLYGMIECDIEVPERWTGHFQNKMSPKEYFGEMSPLFCTTSVSLEEISNSMKTYVEDNAMSKKPRKLLVGGMKARKILIATPLLKWYLEHGLVVTDIYKVIEYIPSACFKNFQDKVSNARRQGDADPSTSIIADTMKLLGNSGYGSLIMNKERHQNVQYVQGEASAKLHINQAHFKNLTELDHDMFEVELAKKRMKLDLPITLGYFILQYAKLRMLQFYYDCLDYYLDRADFEYIEMDTDSAYFSLSKHSLIQAVKPSLQAAFTSRIKNSCHEVNYLADERTWFPRECCQTHIKYDKRTPGLFKLEASGQEMIALSSKTYLLRDGESCKISCKGVNKNSLLEPLPIFHSVLNEKRSVSTVNRGFRAVNNFIYSYEQEKVGFGYFYCKRTVLEDGISTAPLDIVLCPWSNNLTEYVNSFDPLGLDFQCYLKKDEREFQSAYQIYLYELILFHSGDSDEAYKLSQQKTNETIKCNEEWYKSRDSVMKNILILKLHQIMEVKNQLTVLQNKNIVYIDNNIDKYWSCGCKAKIAPLMNENSFPGMNKLGMLWKEIISAYALT